MNDTHPAILGPEDICFITNQVVRDDDTTARFTFEFDSWVSTEGQKIIDEWVDDGMKAKNPEWEIVYREWYAQDAASEANDNNEEFRNWHK